MRAMNELVDKIQSLRTEYLLEKLDLEHVKESPFAQFEYWMNEALSAEIMDPNAMVLSTVSKGGMPSARIVLLRSLSELGLTFYTNYDSHKGEELKENPQACLNFFWPELQRQVRVNGIISKVDTSTSDAYFATRPRESQIGAWASSQSSKLSSRKDLEEKVQGFSKKFDGEEVPRPESWGGYLLSPTLFEFWQGRESRLHDRIVYEKVDEKWDIYRVSP